MKWYVMQVFNNWERKVKEAIEHEVEQRNLTHLLGRIAVPKEKYIQVRNNKKVKTERNYFPGYMMIECEFVDELYKIVTHVDGVVCFLGGKTSSPMKEHEVRNMLEKMDELAEQELITDAVLKVGQKVKIVNGPFESMFGVITNVEKQKVMVDMNIFNRITSLELTHEQVIVE